MRRETGTIKKFYGFSIGMPLELPPPGPPWAVYPPRWRSNVVVLTSDMLPNGVRLMPSRTLPTGDQSQTGPAASLVFAQGHASFKLRHHAGRMVDLDADGRRAPSQSNRRQSFWAVADEINGTGRRETKFMDHTDEGLELLARLINPRTCWQMAGRKGVADGKGKMEFGAHSAKLS